MDKANSFMTESLSYRNQSTDLFCKWIGFYMNETSAMKKLTIRTREVHEPSMVYYFSKVAGSKPANSLKQDLIAG